MQEEISKERANELKEVAEKLDSLVLIDCKETTGSADLEGETVEVKADGTAKEEKPKAPSIRGNLKLINKLIRTVVEEESRRIALGDSIKESIDLINGKIDQLATKFAGLETNEPKPMEPYSGTIFGDIANFAKRISNLEQCIAKMAHYTGGNNPRICKEFGIDNYEVKLKDMSKFAITSG